MILGVVLAGGRSSRFGSDKAAALFRDRPLVDHARAVLAPHVDLVLVAGGSQGGLRDLPRPDLGPLGGIASALDHAAGHGFASVLTIACDMPRVPADLIAALVRRAPTYCIQSPVLGHWPAALGAQLLAYIETSPDRSIRHWAKAIGALPVESVGPIANVNTPADLETL